jgi:transposase
MTNSEPNPRCRVRPIKKNPESEATFKKECAKRLTALIPATNERPIKLWTEDESRFGLHTIRRRRITASGTKPIGRHQHDFKNFWIYGAVAPQTGESHFMEFPTLNGAMFQRFLDDFAQAHPITLNVLVLDNAATHKGSTLRLPENVVLLFQPPYTPEVNPCERVWQAFKTELGWRCFQDLDHLRQYMVAVVARYDEKMLHSLTSYPYLMETVNAVCS